MHGPRRAKGCRSRTVALALWKWEGTGGPDVRPDFNWNTLPAVMMGYRRSDALAYPDRLVRLQ